MNTRPRGVRKGEPDSGPTRAGRMPVRDHQREESSGSVGRRSRREPMAVGHPPIPSDARASGCRRVSRPFGAGSPATRPVGFVRRVGSRSWWDGNLSAMSPAPAVSVHLQRRGQKERKNARRSWNRTACGILAGPSGRPPPGRGEEGRNVNVNNDIHDRHRRTSRLSLRISRIDASTRSGTIGLKGRLRSRESF